MSANFTAAGNVQVWKSRSGPPAFYFRTNSDVNTDGSGHSYHPDDIAGNNGLAQNTICNGVSRKTSGGEADCLSRSDCQACLDLFRSKPKAEMLTRFTRFFSSFAIATKEGAACVVPEGKPNAGYFVSTTAYLQGGKAVCDPERYLDAMVFPAIAVPKKLVSNGVKLGDFVLVRNRQNGRSSFGVVYDTSGSRIGESSIAMNRLLLCDRDRPGCEPPPPPKSYQEATRLVLGDADYLVLAGTVGDWPQSTEAVTAAARAAFESWGGEARLKACAAEYAGQ
ncbi:MAG: hypothetical protein HC855_09125 [Rhizobiales bacterium]|nr:hypothetical protein [Hyphomicrobiales bacterium]